MSQYQLEEGADAREVPVRLLVVQDEARPAVEMEDEDMVMTFPHLVVREAVCFLAVTLVLSILAICFNAPLEGMANPIETPNPAKAPWYFLGLQELLHYYPPLISGILLPGAVVGGLLVIPYFEVNLKREPMWDRSPGLTFLGVVGSAIAVITLLELTAPYHVWAVTIPTGVLAVIIVLPYLLGRTHTGILGWLSTRSIPFWIFTWFVVVAVVLTAIGVFFRGPGWGFTLPWVDGIY